MNVCIVGNQIPFFSIATQTEKKERVESNFLCPKGPSLLF